MDIIDHSKLFSNLCDDQLVNFFKIIQVVLNFFFFRFLLETLCSSEFCEFELKLNLIHCFSTCIMSFNLFMHHIASDLYLCANLQSALGFVFFFFFSLSILLCVFGHFSSTMPRKTRANKVPSTSSMSPSRVQLFKNDRCREAFAKLNSKRKIWAERSMILDEVDLTIRANLESRGWLSLLEIDHPPPTALIREFFSNLSDRKSTRLNSSHQCLSRMPSSA